MTTRPPRRQCAKCAKNRPLSSFVGDRGRTCATCRKATARTSARRGHLLKTYGITQEEYDAILAAQGGVCAVCKGKRPYNLAVDHDHKYERELIEAGLEKPFATRASVRGATCKRCNKILRDVRDDRVLLRQLSDYLAFPPAQLVLRNPQLVAASAE